MNFGEAGKYQLLWQVVRGMDERLNGRWNLDRIQVELDEAKEETDPLKGLGELVDILIISVAGAAMACEDAGVPIEELDNLIKMKLALNDNKYPITERSNFGTTQEFVDFCRATWLDRLAKMEALKED